MSTEVAAPFLPPMLIFSPHTTHTPSAKFLLTREGKWYLHYINGKEPWIDVLCKVLSSQIKWSVL